MSTTDELLDRMENELLLDTDKVLVVDSDLRTVSIPDTIPVLGVENDKDVHRLHFRIPKMYGETDLSEFDIRINYINALQQGDIYAVDDKQVNENDITFSWLVGNTAFAKAGDVQFIICLRKSGPDGIITNEFNSTIMLLPPVLEGMQVSELIVQDNPDIIESILQRLINLEENNQAGESSFNGFPQIDHGTLNTTFELTPNVLHKWGEVSSLDLTLASNEEGIINEYMFTFISGETATQLTLPSTINGMPEIEPNSIYQISIVDNCLAYGRWDYNVSV